VGSANVCIDERTSALVHINLRPPSGFIGDISSVSHPFGVTPLLLRIYNPSLKEENPTSLVATTCPFRCFIFPPHLG